MNTSLYSNELRESDSTRAETAETAKTPGKVPGHLRLILGQRASEALTASGETAFLVVGKASWPDDPSRWVLHAVPLDMAAACAACEVALGTRKAGKRIAAPPEATGAP